MQNHSYRLITLVIGVCLFVFSFDLFGQSPSITSTESQSKNYTEASPAITIDPTIVVRSGANNRRIQAGYVKFSGTYVATEDTLFVSLVNSPVSYTWDESKGILTFTKAANELDYQTAMRAIKYANSSKNPNSNPRDIEYYVEDSKGTFSLIKTINIQLVNDPGWFYLTNENIKADTITYATNKNQSIEICPSIFDPEGDKNILANTSLVNSTGELTLNSNATCITYKPNNDFIGNDFINLKITDSNDDAIARAAVIKIITSEAPQLSNFRNSLNYEENDGYVAVNPNLTILYPGSTLTSARVQIASNYLSAEDTLIYTGTNSTIIKSWSDDKGELTLSGNETLEVYREVLRQIKYGNNSNDPDEKSRSVITQVSDGTISSNTPTTSIVVAKVNDAPFIYGSIRTTAIDTLVIKINEDESEQICPTVFDWEGDDFEISVQTTSDFNSTVSMSSTGLCADFTPIKDGVTTQFFDFRVCDKSDPTLCSITVCQVEINPVNDPPSIFNNGLAVDTLYYGIDINQSVDVCLEVIDIDSNQTSITSIPGPYNFGNVSAINGLCFNYQPSLDAVGNEYLKVIVCDNAINQLCDTVIVHFEIPGTNTAPIFNTNGIDTLQRNLVVDQKLSEVITLINRERDDLLLDTAYLTVNKGKLEVILSDELTYTYTPDPLDSLKQNTAYFKVCDNRSPSLCSELVIDFSLNYQPIVLDQNQSMIDSTGFKMLEKTQFDTCFFLYDFNGHSIFNSKVVSNRKGTLNVNIENQEKQLCLLYNPEPGFIGTEEFTVTLCDNGEPEACTDLVITYAVYETNSKPAIVFNGDSTINHISFQLLENDSIQSEIFLFDQESDQVMIDTIFNLPDGLLYTLQDAVLTFEYTPPTYQWGTYQTVFQFCDNNPFPLCSTLTLEFEIEPVNEAPILFSDSVTITSSDEVVIKVLENDTDPENEGLIVGELISQSTHQGVVFLTDTTLIYRPSPDEYRDEDVIKFTVCDGGVPQVCLESNLTIYFRLPIPNLEIYEAFSPNGDGVNDVWFIDGIREFANNRVTILDQYNKVIFQVEGYDNREKIWAGELDRPGSNNLTPAGTYYYVIDLGDQSETITGFVILKR